MSKTYNLEDAIIDRVEFFHKSKIGNNGNVKNVVVHFHQQVFAMNIRTQTCKKLPPCKVVINDIYMYARDRIGDTFENDCRCDSAFMSIYDCARSWLLDISTD